MAAVNFAPLIAVLGSDNIRTDPESRLRALPLWSPVIGKRRQSGEENLPLAVLFPGNALEVVSLVEWAQIAGVRLSAVGGASSLRPPDIEAEWVAVDTGRLNDLSWDEESLLVTAGAGCRLGEIEAQLGRHGYTIGHFPQTIDQMTVGGAVATNAIGLLSGKYGRQREITVGLEIVVPGLGLVRTSPAPGANAYQDIHDLIIGSEGALGIVTEATLRMRTAPEVRAFAAFSFPNFSTGIDAARLIYRSDARPAGLRILDRVAAADLMPAEALLVMVFEGDELVQTGNYQMAYAVCQEIGGTAEPPEIGDAWFDRRQETNWLAPNARTDAIADILAVSGVWSKIKSIERAVKEAIAPLVAKLSVELCHPSTHGAALEFRFEAHLPSGDPQDALLLHERILQHGMASCRDNDGNIVHHFGIGGSVLRYRSGDETDKALWEQLIRMRDQTISFKR